MRKSTAIEPLSRRGRQIMDVIYKLGEATAADVHARLEDAPTYTTVRGLLRILAEKGHLKVETDGRRYLYKPVTSTPTAGASSIARVVKTFFAGSTADAVAALLGAKSNQISDEELRRLSAIVAEARRNRNKE